MISVNYKLVELNDEEFNEYAINHPLNNFFQSIYMKELLLKENKEVYLLGLKDDSNNIICATLITNSSSFMGYKTYEALKGFLIDYTNEELVKYFTLKLKEFIKNKKGYRLIIDPYIPYVERDIDGKEVENGIDNRYVDKYLKKMGYKSLKNNAQVKWTFVLDTNKNIDELLGDMKPNTRNCINKTLNKFKLIVEEIPYEKLDVFKKITQDTCDRRHFQDRSLSYYQNMFKIFGDKLKTLVCKLDLNLYMNELKSERKELERKIDELSDSNSNLKKKEQFKKDILNINDRISYAIELKDKHGDELILSGAMFVLYGSEIVYLFSGSYDEYMKYNAQYLIQWEIIKYAVKNKYDRYNFYGIEGNFDKENNDTYGIYKFKRGFDGNVVEFIGEFDLIVSKFYYNLYNIAFKTYRGCKHLFVKVRGK